ncbi:DUF3108 domain-containing protein [Fulvivirga sp. RKSG066]|uniref:DUF3108 domain-containing protein n=1 Tax=Fulvivirga aurantia TaxID=2529383 RepID=UPI0012BCEF25|nr:DUF3108 domain-containing protein [Fulvivirga aurantia]MTI21056.1 DUF3108 domain-containing protein [Fulvivirga aurantia]
MKKQLIYLFIITLLFSFDSPPNGAFRHIKHRSFKKGEYIKYKAHYGFVNAAEGEMIISDKTHIINGRSCYKIDVYGRSIGMFDLFLRIRDNWGSYIDTSAIFSHKFYRKIEEGKYRKHEIVDFDQHKHRASVVTYDNKKETWRPAEKFKVPNNVQDMVSGYYYLRTLNFDTLQVGDIIKVDAFFDDEIYDFNIRYVGKDVLKTKLGKINSLILSPIMPENSLFDGENSIKVWISDDLNKVPLKIKAEMFVGAVEIEIMEYRQGQR